MAQRQMTINSKIAAFQSRAWLNVSKEDLEFAVDLIKELIKERQDSEPTRSLDEHLAHVNSIKHGKGKKTEWRYTNDEIVFWAFRYCLGRKTYAVGSFVHNVSFVVNELMDSTKARMVLEINQAIKNGEAGMKMDVEYWIKFRDMLTGEKND